MLITPLYVVLAAILTGAAWDASGLVSDGAAATALAGLAAALLTAVAAAWLAGRYLRGRALELAALSAVVAAYAALVFAFGWKAFVDRAQTLEAIPGAGALAEIAPALAFYLVAGAVLVRTRAGRADRAVGLWREPRHLLVPLAPYLLFAAVVDLRAYFPGVEETLYVNDSAAIALVVGFLTLLVALAPWLVRLLWPAEPLAPGPLRDRLVSLAARAGVRFREIHVWHTGRLRVANACIAGVLPRARAVFLTDRLLGRLGPREIEAVFAHELGHARRRHFLWYYLLAIAFLLALLWIEARPAVRALPDVPRYAGFLALLLLYWRGLFGWISRWMELEADAFAVRLTGDPAGFAAALAAIGALSGGARSWRHFPIARRVRFVLGAWPPRALRTFARRRLAARVLVLALAAASAASWIDFGIRDLRRPPWRAAVLASELALDRARRGREAALARAIALARSAAFAEAADPETRARALDVLAEAYAAAGRGP